MYGGKQPYDLFGFDYRYWDPVKHVMAMTADIAVWSMLGWIAQGVLDDIPRDLPMPFERLTSLYNEISKMPKVQDWKRLTYAYDEPSTGEYNYHVPDTI